MNPPLSRNGGPPERFEGEGSEVVVEETIRFIDKAKREQRPFFTVVWFGSPHEPYSGLDEDLALYDDLPARYQDRSVPLTSMETGLNTTRPLGEVLRERYAEITAMDRAIGTLRRHLEDEGLRENTIFWYCGDNGIPVSGHATTPFRGLKGQVYEGGVRVPGVIEWPRRIPAPRASDVNAVTSDMLPTICDLVGLLLPERPLDGVSLKPLIDGEMTERPRPICFWQYNMDLEREGEPYIDPRLQEGTTPLVKVMDGQFTRSFENFHQRSFSEQDFSGSRAILDNRYKLVVGGRPGHETASELFDLRGDRAEKVDLTATQPEIAKRLEGQLREWQESVLNSLTEADYS
jgi:arylsulfatase A-like enzyme